MSVTCDVTFCDDLRIEISGKAILVGVYGQTLRTPGDIPFTIDRLVLACRLYIPAHNVPEFGRIGVFYPQSTKEPDILVGVDMPAQISEEDLKSIKRAENSFDPRYQLIFQIELKDINIDVEGFIRVRGFFGDQYVRLGDLQIAKMEEEASVVTSDDIST